MKTFVARLLFDLKINGSVVFCSSLCSAHRDEERANEKLVFPFVGLRDRLSHCNDTQLEGNMCTVIMNYTADSLRVGNQDH